VIIRLKKRRANGRPFNCLRDREEFLYAIKYVDNVIVFNSKEELEKICEVFQPDIRVVGGDWKDKEIVGSQFCKEIIFFDRIPGYSTTRILLNDKN